MCPVAAMQASCSKLHIPHHNCRIRARCLKVLRPKLSALSSLAHLIGGQECIGSRCLYYRSLQSLSSASSRLVEQLLMTFVSCWAANLQRILRVQALSFSQRLSFNTVSAFSLVENAGLSRARLTILTEYYAVIYYCVSLMPGQDVGSAWAFTEDAARCLLRVSKDSSAMRYVIPIGWCRCLFCSLFPSSYLAE